VGRCIYCGKPPKKLPAGQVLSSEHIFPEGIKGDHELLEASCPKCAAATSQFEEVCLRGIFLPARAHFGVYGKQSRRVTHLPVILIAEDGSQESIRVPIDEHPFQLCLPGFPLAGVLQGRPRYAGFANIDIQFQTWGVLAPE
jgi:hypothetical protein